MNITVDFLCFDAMYTTVGRL